MKKLFFFLILGFSALTLNSCLEGYNDSTPRLYYDYFRHNWVDSISPGDTLRIKVIDEKWMLDTVAVGDSVRFAIIGRSFANNLVSVVFEYDPAVLRMDFTDIYDEEGKKQCLDTNKSVVSEGKYYFLPGYNSVGFPVFYYPIAAGKSTIKMTLTSDANSERVPNSTTLEFVQVVVSE